MGARGNRVERTMRDGAAYLPEAYPMRALSYVSLVAAVGGCAMGGSKKSAQLAAPPHEMAYAGDSPMQYAIAEPQPTVANTEDYTDYGKNPWIMADKDRFSTFAADVDTASYT